MLVFLERRWLYRVFQGQYLRRFSTNQVAINKELEKLLPQLYQITLKICYDQAYNGIRVVIATKWRHYYLLTCSRSISWHWESFTGAFSSENFSLCFLQIFGRTLTWSSFLYLFLTMLNAALNPLAIRSCQNSQFALSRNEKYKCKPFNTERLESGK